ncbi:MAG: hypothetical protein HPY59_12180 [Anaerolineae bacterium]|nr:hypothetical protein [Anaerolineae bacterium]
MDEGTTKAKTLLHWIMIASAIEALLAVVFLARIPVDQKNVFLFGYSPARLLLFLLLGLCAGCCLLLAFALRTRPNFPSWLLPFFEPFLWQRKAFLSLLLGLIFFCLLILLSPFFQAGRWVVLINRLEPLVGWILIFAIQIYFYFVLTPEDFLVRLRNRWLVGFVGVVFLVLFVNRLPQLLYLARVVDLQTSHSVVMGVDDIEYIAPAINMINGYGYVQSLVLPLEIYHTAPVSFLEPPAPGKYVISHRPPGTSFLLALLYGIFGTEVIVPRLGFIFLAWMTGLLLLFIGAYLAGWGGAIAGGLAGLYYCYFSQAVDYALGLGVVNSEIPGVFWFVLFTLLFNVFLRKRSKLSLAAAALSLSMFVMTRGNYFPSIFFLLAWMLLFLDREGRKQALVFAGIALLPSLLWSLYLNIFRWNTGHYYEPQAVSAFAMTNNLDVLEGVGPQHINRGDWPPQDGVYQAYGLEPEYWPKSGENPTLKGLKFWWDYRDELPILFYRKLKVGTWYHDGVPRYPLGRIMNGFFIAGVGFLLAALGLRPAVNPPGLLPSWPARRIVFVQLIQIAILFLVSNFLAFWLVLLLWGSITLFAIFRPYGDAVQLPFDHPSWMVSFVTTYLVATMVYASDRQRYHAQLDPVLLFYSLLGVGLVGGFILARLIFRRILPKNTC